MYIWDQHKNYLRGDRKDGQPCSLTKDEIEDILQNIPAGHGKTNPIYPTYNDFLIKKAIIYHEVYIILLDYLK